MRITFPGGKKVNAEFGGTVIATDQPAAAGGEASAPSPYEYFLASMGTCAGIFVLSFCEERGISTQGLGLTQRVEFAPSPEGKRRLARLIIDIDLPEGFPEKYRNAIVKTAGLCSVKKAILDPPEFEINAR